MFMFTGEESNSSANKCLLKVAQYAAQLENYQKAIEIYEQVASASLDNSLLKYSAKEYFFRAVLCHMCGDLLDAQHALQRYESMYPAFQVNICITIAIRVMLIMRKSLNRIRENASWLKR